MTDPMTSWAQPEGGAPAPSTPPAAPAAPQPASSQPGIEPAGAAPQPVSSQPAAAPQPVSSQPAAAPQPVSSQPAAAPQPVSAPLATPPTKGSGRATNILLGVAVAVAVAGLAFAGGRLTAPASAGGLQAGRGGPAAGIVDPNQAGNVDPNQASGLGQGGPGGTRAVTITGTVKSLDGSTLDPHGGRRHGDDHRRVRIDVPHRVRSDRVRRGHRRERVGCRHRLWRVPRPERERGSRWW